MTKSWEGVADGRRLSGGERGRGDQLLAVAKLKLKMPVRPPGRGPAGSPIGSAPLGKPFPALVRGKRCHFQILRLRLGPSVTPLNTVQAWHSSLHSPFKNAVCR